MNNSISTLTLDEPSVINVNSPEQNENLTTLGVFLSSLLLSVGGLFAMVMSSIRNSKCKNVKCCGLSCESEIEEV